VYLLRDLIGLFLFSCFFALLLSPFVGRLKKWRIPDVLGILITFMSLFLIVGLFVLSIVPVFVGLAEDSKTYISHTASAFESQARANFPIIDQLPFRLGVIIRNEVNVDAFRDFIVDENRAQFVMNGLIGNIDIVRNFVQQSLGQFSTVSLSFASGVTTAVTTFSLFILLTFFIILERRVFLRWFFAILPADL
jgi:predicted PurR-regulated permease PerM